MPVLSVSINNNTATRAPNEYLVELRNEIPRTSMTLRAYSFVMNTTGNAANNHTVNVQLPFVSEFEVVNVSTLPRRISLPLETSNNMTYNNINLPIGRVDTIQRRFYMFMEFDTTDIFGTVSVPTAWKLTLYFEYGGVGALG